jgi:signal transduction histidine kinase
VHRPVAAPRRLRRRITVVVLLVAGLSAGALALGSFLLVRHARLQDSLDRAKSEATLDLRQAAGLRRSSPVASLLESYEQRGVHTILLIGSRRFASSPALNPPLPADLQILVRRGDIAFERVKVRGVDYLVVGGRAPRSQAELYFFFFEGRLHQDLRQLGTVLAIGWVAAVVLAGLVGAALARRTLDPVAKASQAARAMAEGLLETRLPVETRDEFGAWAASFNEMAEALGDKIRALSEAQERERRFTSDVAHELRTPLAALVGEASLLREHLDRLPEETRRPAELLIGDVARLRKLVDDLLEISRLDAGREELRVDRVDVKLLLEATLRSRGWGDRIEVRGESLALETDRRRLERVLANLMGNAVEHAGGRAAVTLGRDGGAVFVEVADRGPGVASADLPHLFDRFYKADRARSGPGFGLGLAIALENARLLGGSLEVTSPPGRGARFTLWLPDAQRLPDGDTRVSTRTDDEVVEERRRES